MSASDWTVLWVFSYLSVIAIGGGAAVLPEVKALTVGAEGWLTDSQFLDFYALGQLAPGPNMLMVVAIGYHVSGLFGALLAYVGFFAPAGLITFGATRVWDRFEGSPWRLAIQRGLAPVVVGLMASGTISVGRTALSGPTTDLLAAAVFLVLALRQHTPPVLVIAAGAAVGLALLG